MSKMRRKNGVNFLRVLDILTEAFLPNFVKTAGHRVTKIYPVYCSAITYKSYYIKIFVARKK